MASPALALESHHDITCGAEVWIATALLTREQPGRENFLVEEIMARVGEENIYGTVRPGVEVHARLHCCADKAPNPSTLRMLCATGRNTRRLYRNGDRTHPARTGRTMPAKEEVPEKYHELIDWWQSQTPSKEESPQRPKTFLEVMQELREAGEGVWSGENPDEYVRRLREEWD